jgi:signal transduction histidine kinase
MSTEPAALARPLLAAAGRFAPLLAALLLAGAAPVGAAEAPQRVLVLYAYGRLLPAMVQGEQGLRQALAVERARPVELFDEFLDLPRFEGDDHLESFTRYLRDKYQGHSPDVIVAAGDAALQFVVARAAALFPEAPVVHMAVAAATVSALTPPPAGLVGVPMELDFSGSMQLALRLHPTARRMVVVTGGSALDRQWEARCREAGAGMAGWVTVEHLAGLPTPAVLERLRRLGGDTVVFTPGFFKDGEGRDSSPRAAAEAMATASSAPIYGTLETFIGAGIVGGVVPSFAEIGRQAGALVIALLDGAAPATLRPPAVTPVAVHLDWRQVERWSIREAAIPPGAVIHFRTPTFLEQHRTGAGVALAAFLLQSGLIAGLLVERRRRRRAERVILDQRAALAHASRLAVAGELTGAIAHQINQPLGAIQSNAEAAELLLESGAPASGPLKEILADIRRDNQRASEVIRRLRSLLARHEMERKPFDLAEAAEDAGTLLLGEARSRRAELVVRADGAALVTGDRIQVQQAVINLLLNALDAVAGAPEGRRTVEVSVGVAAGVATLVVRDRGPGIAPEHLPHLFDSFFTTKATGMGLGLSIARTLVEAHGGTLRAESEAGAGAAFHLELPAADLRARAGEDA